jgi:hypothetical protein
VLVWAESEVRWELGSKGARICLMAGVTVEDEGVKGRAVGAGELKARLGAWRGTVDVILLAPKALGTPHAQHPHSTIPTSAFDLFLAHSVLCLCLHSVAIVTIHGSRPVRCPGRCTSVSVRLAANSLGYLASRCKHELRLAVSRTLAPACRAFPHPRTGVRAAIRMLRPSGSW